MVKESPKVQKSMTTTNSKDLWKQFEEKTRMVWRERKKAMYVSWTKERGEKANIVIIKSLRI